MNFPWLLFVDLGVVAGALLTATFLRYRLRLFQKYLIPNAVTAGLLAMLFYNLAAPSVGLDTGNLEAATYHLLSLSFVAMSLRRPIEKSRETAVRAASIGVSVLTHYAIQATVGLILTFVFIGTLMPDLFPSFGFLLPMGFSAGPGQAYAVGQKWEPLGFAGAGSVGLTFAAVGYLWACLGGVVLINRGLKKGWGVLPGASGNSGAARGVYERGTELPIGSRLTTDTIAIDGKTYTVAVVLATYLLTYLLLQAITFALAPLGAFGKQLTESLWAIAFIFAALTAMGVRHILQAAGIEHTVDDGSLTRIAGLSIDMGVAAALGAISLSVVGAFWLPILVMSTVAGVLAYVLIPALGRWIYPDRVFARSLIVYGSATGTLSTGLALLRVVDPEFKSPVSTDFMYASTMVFAAAAPMIVFLLDMPARGYTTGNPVWYWVSLAICAAYLAAVALMHVALARGLRRRRAAAGAAGVEPQAARVAG